MAIFRCPSCQLPLLAAETESGHCPVCGAALAPEVEAAPVAATVAQPPRRRLWLVGGVVPLLALLLGGAWLTSRETKPAATQPPLKPPEPVIARAKREPAPAPALAIVPQERVTPQTEAPPRAEPAPPPPPPEPPKPQEPTPALEKPPAPVEVRVKPQVSPWRLQLKFAQPRPQAPALARPQPEQIGGERPKLGIMPGQAAPAPGWEDFNGRVEIEQYVGNRKKSAARSQPRPLSELRLRLLQQILSEQQSGR